MDGFERENMKDKWLLCPSRVLCTVFCVEMGLASLCSTFPNEILLNIWMAAACEQGISPPHRT